MKKEVYHILYIEDDEVDILYMKRLLRDSREQLVLEVAHSFNEGINILREKEIDIIISDNQLNDGTLMEYMHEFKQVPFLITSGLDNIELKKLSGLSGAKGSLSKPVDKNLLLKKIQEALSPEEVLSENKSEVPFSFKSLETISGGDEMFARQMIEALRSKFPGNISSLKKGILSGQLSEVKKIAHNLKSSFKIFGGNEIGDICSKIESIMHDNRTSDGIDELIKSLEEKGNKFISELSGLVKEKDCY